MSKTISLIITVGVIILGAAAINISDVDAKTRTEFIQVSVLSEHQADYGVEENLGTTPAISLDIIEDKMQDDVPGQSSVPIITYTSFPQRLSGSEDQDSNDPGSTEPAGFHDNNGNRNRERDRNGNGGGNANPGGSGNSGVDPTINGSANQGRNGNAGSNPNGSAGDEVNPGNNGSTNQSENGNAGSNPNGNADAGGSDGSVNNGSADENRNVGASDDAKDDKAQDKQDKDK